MSKLQVAYSCGEAAEILGVHRNTVRNMIQRGELRATKHGRDWRIPLAALRDDADRWESVLLKQRLAQRAPK